QNSDYLAQNINSVMTKLESMQSQIEKDIQDNVDSINSSIDTLRELDKHIKLVEGSGKTPNDLYDQRDAIIDELSFKMDLTKDDTQKFLESAMEPGREVVVGEDKGGNTVLKVSVKEVYNSQGSYLGSVDLTKAVQDEEGNVTGYQVVNSRGEQIGYMNVDAQGDPTGSVYINDIGEVIAPNDIQLDLSQASGELQGSVDMIKNIDTYIKDLKDMSEYLADAVNEILNDPPAFDEDGEEIKRELFVVDANGRLTVSPDAKSTLGSIPGNDMVDMAGKIYNLKNEAIIPVSDSNGNPVLDSNGEKKFISLNTFYNDMIQRLGNETQQVLRDESNQSKILNEIESSRISVTGVSLDEEMINLIQFQHSYNASAKVISIIDSLLEVVVNGLKR
ncbi:MAG: flagellar basal body rod C-terminal domain-containing protein, partial [Peptostreptococcaceae bacterium]